ncbi:MAG: hypothetical protein ABI341_03090 [Nitrososphaera sp.]
MLAQFDLMPLAELRRSIRRYKPEQAGRLIRDLRADLYEQRRRGRRVLYVVKLVSATGSWGLPNLRIEKLRDVTRIPGFLNEHREFPFIEVWYCKTRIDQGILSVAGRFVFVDKGSSCGQFVEQVWRCSPRLLEQFSDAFEYPYLAASRLSWGWPYKLDKMHIPRGREVTACELKEEFYFSMRVFERHRENICQFLKFLSSCGFSAYSLEYKIIGSRLVIIDWDTPNDAIAIQSAFPFSQVT